MGRPDVRLGRPDIFHPRIVLAGCPQLVAGDGDDAELVAALRVRDLHARWLSWDDPEAAQADLVILRATWDYPERLDEFLTWAGSVRNVLNPLPVVRWNTDKRYLNDLAAAGIPTVPSTFFAPDEPIVLPDGELVIKPAVAGGSRGAGRFTCPEAARNHAEALQDEGRTVLIQPYDRGSISMERPRWSFSTVNRRMRLPRQRCCLRRALPQRSMSRACSTPSDWHR
ncbi:glutathione synthase/ribosomal protein S6 modification enzyme (glutaminyl transferase) [Mycobacteroides abscessus]|nr:glutathione synthase/ribosomal protein S6 modification enzyme (glutaminyl transferase) [Mycobacteroides abscessus]